MTMQDRSPRADARVARNTPAASATVVVISHERADLRDQAVASVRASIRQAGRQFPVMVIDSSRETRPAPADVTLVHRPNEPSCVAKRGLAFELAGTDWVVLLDDDCRVTPDAIATLAAALTSVEHVRTAGIFVVTEFVGERTPMFRAALHSDLMDGFTGADEEGDPVWGVTTLSAFRRGAVLAVGAFGKENLDVPVGGEDVDACIRLRGAGWRLHRIPAVLALHNTATWRTFGQNLRRSRNYGAAEAELVRSHPRHTRFGYENLLVSGALGAVCGWLAAAGGRGRCRPALAGGLLGWGAAELAELRARHREASAPELAVQIAWSAAYEYGRLCVALARRQPRLALHRFNWEDSMPRGYSAALPRGVPTRLLVTGVAAAAATRTICRRRYR